MKIPAWVLEALSRRGGYTPSKHSRVVKWAIQGEAVPNYGAATSGVAL
jgi:hypothetical protein